MPDLSCLAEVRIWGRTVGAVAELSDGRLVFEYDRSFMRSGLEISPRKLPLSSRGAITFPELARSDAFEGLPGVLADSLPDRFGNAIIRKYFADRGKPDAAMSPVQKLLYVGSRAMGALEYRPAHRIPRNSREGQALEVAALVSAARSVVEGRTEVAIPEIIRLGSSAGGARAKAVILWNRAEGQVRSAFARVRPGDEPWMIKFDGVGELGNPNHEPQPFNRIEYAYAGMAREAGVHMAEVHLLEERGRAHFMTRRFDRVDGKRMHMHTLGGMEHVDYNMPGIYSYEQYLRLVLALGLGHSALEQAFRRACFNIMAVNQDDHTKNMAFLMDPSGTWSLSPAYDLTFARGRGYTRLHQMSLAGKREAFQADDLISLGSRFGIRNSGRDIVQEVAAAVAMWPVFARRAGVPSELVDAIAAEHRLECAAWQR